MEKTSALEKFLIIFNLVGIFAGLGVFLYQEYFYKRPVPKDGKEFEVFLEKESVPMSGTPFKLSKMIINLPSSPRVLHYINVEVGMIPFLDHHRETLNMKKAVLYDALITEVGKMRHTELSAMTGKIILEERLKHAMNQALGRAYIKKVLFTTYVIQ